MHFSYIINAFHCMTSPEVELPDVQKSYSIKWTEDDDVAYSPSYGFGFANKQHEIPVMVRI